MQVVTYDKARLIEEASSSLLNLLLSKRETLLLLSSGSWVDVYKTLSPYLISKDLSHVTVTLMDERWQPITHIDNNAKQLYDSGFIETLISCGARWFPWVIRTDGDPREVAKEIDDNLKRLSSQSIYTVCTLGIGDDGHTSGIIPMSERKWQERFSDVSLVTYYELAASETANPHLKRVTTTPAFFSRIDEVLLYAVGLKKLPVLTAWSSQPEGDLHSLPSRLIHRCAHVTMYTDQVLSH